MTVSVALCTFNGASYIGEQLDSILHQTVPPDEIVICDDCSDDHTTDIITDYITKATVPIRLYNNEKQFGFVKNFEKAISLCKGEIICLSDQDDVWMPEKVNILRDLFMKRPAVGLIFTDAELVDERLCSLSKRLWEISFSEKNQRLFAQNKSIDLLSEGYMVTGATMAFRSGLKKFILPFPEKKDFIHDAWIALVAASVSMVLPLDIPLIKYRQHDKQQVGTIFGASENRLGEPSGKETGSLSVDRLQKEVTVCRTKLERIGKVKERLQNMKGNDPHVDLARVKQLDAIIIFLTWKITHFNRRVDLNKIRIKRVPVIIRELVNGGYHRFSNGFKSAIRDILR